MRTGVVVVYSLWCRRIPETTVNLFLAFRKVNVIDCQIVVSGFSDSQYLHFKLVLVTTLIMCQCSYNHTTSTISTLPDMESVHVCDRHENYLLEKNPTFKRLV